MTVPRWNDDDALLAELDRALRAAREVPRDFIETGKGAWAWRDIDADLAALTYDSALDAERAPALTRAEPAPLRALTFASAELAIELEVTDEALLGQVVPPQPGEVEVHLADGRILAAGIDEVGGFAIRPVPSRSFRLRCRTESGASVLTDWIAL